LFFIACFCDGFAFVRTKHKTKKTDEVSAGVQGSTFQGYFRQCFSDSFLVACSASTAINAQ
jgi:hypothetical protein